MLIQRTIENNKKYSGKSLVVSILSFLLIEMSKKPQVAGIDFQVCKMAAGVRKRNNKF